jgi:protein ImuB
MSADPRAPIPDPGSPIPALYACLYQPPHPDHAAHAAPGDNPLVRIAADFSPRFERHREDLVAIDVSGLDRLLGPARTIGEELRRTAVARGLSVHVAVAGTQTAAIVLAQARPGLTMVECGGEAAALAPIPIGVLEKIGGEGASILPGARKTSEPKDAAGALVSVLQRWGVKTLGEVAAMPAADLAARLGPAGLVWQRIARGADVRPLVPLLEEERFESSLELEWPIEGLEPLSFVLTRLLEPLSTRLERRDRGAAVVHVVLRLVTKDRVLRSLQLPSPLRDVRTLRTLVLLDLDAHPPDAAIDGVQIVIDPTPGRVLQHTLFTRAHPTVEQISTLLARLGALIGQDRIGAAALVDSYRPGAFAMQPFSTDHHDQRGAHTDRGDRFDGAASAALNVVAALRRCRHPVPARVAIAEGRPVRVTTDRGGFTGGAVLGCTGPWRTSGEWWTGEAGGAEAVGAAGKPGRAGRDGPWDRDEWDVALGDGGIYRIFRDRTRDAWFIDAIVD